MRPSRRAARFTGRWEGFRSCPYRDAVGVWTIGYGTTRGVGPTTPCISKRKARHRLKRDLEGQFASAVRNLKPRRRFTQAEFDALCSWAYNVGAGAVATSTLAKRLAAGEPVKRVIRQELPRWNKGGGVVLPGLTARREAEVRLALVGDYSGRP